MQADDGPHTRYTCTMSTAQETTVPLSWLVEEGMRLFAWCVQCHHHGIMDVAPLIARLGANHPIPQVADSLVCTACGARDCTVNPNWNDVDIPGAPKVFPVAPF